MLTIDRGCHRCVGNAMGRLSPKRKEQGADTSVHALLPLEDRSATTFVLALPELDRRLPGERIGCRGAGPLMLDPAELDRRGWVNGSAAEAPVSTCSVPRNSIAAAWVNGSAADTAEAAVPTPAFATSSQPAMDTQRAAPTMTSPMPTLFLAMRPFRLTDSALPCCTRSISMASLSHPSPASQVGCGGCL